MKERPESVLPVDVLRKSSAAPSELDRFFYAFPGFRFAPSGSRRTSFRRAFAAQERAF